MADSTDLAPALIESSIRVYRSNKQWADKAVAQLPDERLRVSLDPETNSVAVIMKHVAGNLLSRWTDFLTTDGEKEWRDRDSEFVDDFASRAEMLACWETGWSCLFTSLDGLQPADLTKTVTIRGEPHTVPLAIQRSLAHTAYHCGQIILVCRILAEGEWETITIPRGRSAEFNRKVWGKSAYP